MNLLSNKEVLEKYIGSLPTFSEIESKKVDINQAYVVRHHGKVFLTWWVPSKESWRLAGAVRIRRERRRPLQRMGPLRLPLILPGLTRHCMVLRFLEKYRV